MKKTLFALFLLMSAGCGFHLRATHSAAPALTAITIAVDETVEPVVLDALRQQFLRRGIALNSDVWRLKIDEHYRQRIEAAIGGQRDHQVSEVDIVDGYRAQLWSGEKLLAEMPIAHRASVVYSSAKYSGSSAEEEKAHRDLAKMNAESVLRFIDASMKQQQLPQ